MIKLSDMKFKCHWDETRICENERLCRACEHQPPDDEKPNGRKAPVKISWEIDYDGSKFPCCPACGEMPYGYDRCTFCGQRFIQDDPQLQAYAKPAPEERMDCIMCGGENTMVGHRTKSNGHFHGHCEKCGCIVME